MSEYGIKIKNIEGASLYENNIGVRNHFDYKDAMLTNSLFYDFLKANGLNVYKGKSTRDIICIEFNFGTRSYEEEIKHIEKMIEKTKRDTSLTEENREQKLLFFDELKKEADRNKDKYKKITKEELREELYTNGVDVKYITRDKKGNVKKEEVLHYKMLYRSTGKAKKGSCMFIIDELYDKAVDFLRMGIKLPKEQAKIVEVSAYSPLVSSTIVGKIHIEPENILILKDVDSFCRKDVVSVELDENKHCIAKRLKDYELTSVLFDGQALIDYSVFPSWGNGYVLLRHHFFKCASFKTDIQGFFKDYYGDKYETAKITDMFGVEHYVKDIKLITTDNACKWIKFSIPYEYWCQKVHENNSMFGVVKTAHKSKLGDVQQMSYQMVNSLNLGSMDKVVKDTMDYIMLLKKDYNVFLDYLEMNKNFSNDFEVLIALVKQNREFIRSEYFRSRRYKIIENYIKNFRQGKIIQNADNLVIVGNPYGMLMYAVGLNPEEDPTLNIEDGLAIQCYTKRFVDGEYLAEFRSPFNGLNNMGYLHNIHHPLMEKYFDFGEMIIAVNCIHTDFEDRNNGSDFDSDSIYTTNQPRIVDRAKQCVEQYHTIVNNIPKSNKTYNNTLLDFANMDNNLAKAQLAIGSSSNLAQICLTYMYNFDDQMYEDYLCILSVLAQVAIDNCKRQFEVDLTNEINYIKKMMNVTENGYPLFWLLLHPNFDRANIDKTLNCPMNYLYSLEIPRARSELSTLPMDNFLIFHEVQKKDWRRNQKVEALITKYSLQLFEYNVSNNNDTKEEYLLLRSDFEDMIEEIRGMYISSNYLSLFSWLLNKAFNSKRKKNAIEKNKSLLLKTLYEANRKNFLECFSKE